MSCHADGVRTRRAASLRVAVFKLKNKDRL